MAMASPQGTDTSHHTLIASDRVEGTSVRRPNGDKIGSILRLMIDKVSGQVAYAVLSFGGFLGFGEKHLPIAWERLRYDPLLGAYELDITDDEVAQAPSYAADPNFDWGDRTEELRAYRMPPYPGI